MDAKPPTHSRRTLARAISEHHGLSLIVALATVGGFVLALALAGADLVIGSEHDDGESSSNASNLSVTSGASDEGVTSYVLPLGTDFSTFPWEANPGCTPEQRTWLAEHGLERQASLAIDVRNTAAGGQSQLALGNVRLDGTFTEEPANPVIHFECPGAGQADTVRLVQPIEAGTRAKTVDGGQFGFNLQPGELGILALTLDGSAGFTGDLVVDVASGDSVEPVVLIGDLKLPALGRWGDEFITVGFEPNTYYCQSAGGDAEVCSASEIAAFVEAAEEGAEIPEADRESESASCQATEVPARLAGTWCTGDQISCVDFADILAQYPDGFFEDASRSDDGSRTYTFCTENDLGELLGAPSCTEAAAMYFDYFSAGVGWDCVAHAGDRYRGCDPDYTSEHDVSKARLVQPLNHQQDTVYVDSPPMYRQ